EVVVPALSKGGMPVGGYGTGDITGVSLEPCACGRTSARMARIKGRADDMLVIRGVNLYPSEVEAALLAVDELDAQYQLVVDRRATLVRLEIQVEPSPAFVAGCGGVPGDPPARRALRP